MSGSPRGDGKSDRLRIAVVEAAILTPTRLRSLVALIRGQNDYARIIIVMPFIAAVT
jgi:hypothetical protein